MNYLLTLASAISKLLVRAGTFLLVAPILGPVNQASIAVTSGWASLACLLLIFGLPVRALTQVSRNPSSARSHFIGDSRAMSVLLLPVGLLAVLLALFVIKPGDRLIFGLLMVATVFTVLGDYCAAILRATGHFANEAWISLGTGVFHFGLIVIAFSFRDPVSVAAAIMGSRVVFAAVSVGVLFSTRSFRARNEHEIPSAMQVLRESRPFALDAFLATAFTQVDVLILDFFASREVVGVYAAGSRFVGLFLALPPILQNVVIPSLASKVGTVAYTPALGRFRLIMTSSAMMGFALVAGLGHLFTQVFLGIEYASVNALWPYLGLLLLARYFESYKGILMYVHGRIGARVLRLAAALAALIVFGSASLLVGGVELFIVSNAIVYCGVGLSYMLASAPKTVLA